MDEKRRTLIGRRDLFRVVASVGVAATVTTAASSPTGSASKDDRGKRKSQYRADSVEVQTFYRVNRYPTK